MKPHENYHLHCLLKSLMAAQGVTVDELHRVARVSRATISQLRKNNFQGVRKQAIARICGAMGIGIGDLFELLPEDIWLPIRLAKEVTIHFGSRAESEPHPVRPGSAPTVISRQSLGSWDFRAFKWISEYLMGIRRDIRVRVEEHITGGGRGGDPQVQASAQRIFKEGNHIVLASPVANQFAEEVVCHAYSVPPYNPEMRDRFPYGFVWDGWRQVRSSFGWQGHGKQFGIVALPSNRMVAPHVMVPVGAGSDGALILVFRVFQAPAQRETGDDDERVIICLLGYGGLGTYAAALLATDPEHAAGLYPPARQVPRMRALSFETFREASASPVDRRTLTASKLIPEHKPPAPIPLRGASLQARANGGKPGRRR